MKIKDQFIMLISEREKQSIGDTRFYFVENHYVDDYEWFTKGVEAAAKRLQEEGSIARQLASKILSEIT